MGGEQEKQSSSGSQQNTRSDQTNPPQKRVRGSRALNTHHAPPSSTKSEPASPAASSKRPQQTLTSVTSSQQQAKKNDATGIIGVGLLGIIGASWLFYSGMSWVLSLLPATIWQVWELAIPVLVSTIYLLLVACAIIAYPLSQRVSQRRRKLILFGSILCILAGGLFACCQLGINTVPVVNVAALFLPTVVFLRQGLHIFLMNLPIGEEISARIYLLPEVVTLFALFYLSQFSRSDLYFHMILAILAIACFKFASERSIPELEAGERAKVGDTETNKPAVSFYTTLQGYYAGINSPLLGLLEFLTFFNLSQRLILSNWQGTVFQAGLALLTIVLSFMFLILGQRKRSENPKQRYILQGLTGITLIYIVISTVAFLAMAITPNDPSKLVVPDFTHSSLLAMLTNKDESLSLLLFALYEWVFLAVPLSLAYIYAIARDFLARY